MQSICGFPVHNHTPSWDGILTPQGHSPAPAKQGRDLILIQGGARRGRVGWGGAGWVVGWDLDDVSAPVRKACGFLGAFTLQPFSASCCHPCFHAASAGIKKTTETSLLLHGSANS